jgi:hypothetical protein
MLYGYGLSYDVLLAADGLPMLELNGLPRPRRGGQPFPYTLYPAGERFRRYNREQEKTKRWAWYS